MAMRAEGFGITSEGHDICHVGLEEEPGLCEEHSPPDPKTESQRDSEWWVHLTSVWVLYHRN